MDVAVYTAMRRALTQNVAPDVQEPQLSRAGKIAALGIAATAPVLLISSALDTQLGLPAAIGQHDAYCAPSRKERSRSDDQEYLLGSAAARSRTVCFGAGQHQAQETINRFLPLEYQRSATGAAGGGGVIIALASNLINNLPSRIARYNFM